MKRVLPLALLVLGACSSDEDADAVRVTRMHEAIEELMTRPEHDAETVEVQHCLIGVGGHSRLVEVTRSPEEAERLTAEVWAEAADGASFDDIVHEHSNDTSPDGIYRLTSAAEGSDEPGNEVYPRRIMADGFGDVAWRLDVGEIGVAAYDREEGSSPFGWHVIKRLR